MNAANAETATIASSAANASTSTTDIGIMAVLQRFQIEANAHARVASLLKGWNPTFHLECTDTGLLFSLRVKDGRVDAVCEGHSEASHVIRLLANENDLKRLFSGELHPVQAHSDGVLEVYGDSKDQVKLDAITMILWQV